ncbi:MAG: hypothetical protein ACRDV9_09120 [Acidimicrobiia bacterium]
MEQPEPPFPDAAETGRVTEPRRRRLRSGVVAGGLAVGLALAGLGVAAAQETPTTDGIPSPAAKDERAREEGARKVGPGPGGRFGHRGFGHPGMAGFGAIHGEFTLPGPDDGYRTVASQRGKVTKVSQSSIEAESEDGYVRTYEVDERTMVNAGRDGIGDIKVGDEVQIAALVEGKTARAVRILDLTNVKRHAETWRGRGPSPNGGQGS